MRRLSLVAGGSSLLLHLGLMTLLLNRGFTPKILPGDAGMTVSIDNPLVSAARLTTEDAGPIRPVVPIAATPAVPIAPALAPKGQDVAAADLAPPVQAKEAAPRAPAPKSPGAPPQAATAPADEAKASSTPPTVRPDLSSQTPPKALAEAPRSGTPAPAETQPPLPSKLAAEPEAAAPLPALQPALSSQTPPKALAEAPRSGTPARAEAQPPLPSKPAAEPEAAAPLPALQPVLSSQTPPTALADAPRSGTPARAETQPSFPPQPVVKAAVAAPSAAPARPADAIVSAPAPTLRLPAQGASRLSSVPASTSAKATVEGALQAPVISDAVPTPPKAPTIDTANATPRVVAPSLADTGSPIGPVASTLLNTPSASKGGMVAKSVKASAVLAASPTVGPPPGGEATRLPTLGAAPGPAPAAVQASAPVAAGADGPAEPPALAPAVPEAMVASQTAPPDVKVAMSDEGHAVADMLSFIRRYDGGSCFLVAPIGVTADQAVIDSFSMSHEPTDAFDAAFRAKTGLDASVVGQRVSKAQCPAVDFLRQARGHAATAPILQIDRSPLHAGDILSGRVREVGDRHVTLLLVSETGEVENVTRGLTGEGTGQFSIRLKRLAPERLAPQLLLAITSRAPLPDAEIPATATADNFRRLSEVAAESDQALEASGKLFLFSR